MTTKLAHLTIDDLQSKLKLIIGEIESAQEEIDSLESQIGWLEEDQIDIENEIARRVAENVESEPKHPTREQQLAAGQLELPLDSEVQS